MRTTLPGLSDSNPSNRSTGGFICGPSSFHPYECDGPGKCVHCDRRYVVASSDEGTNYYAHDPKNCALCDPAYDGGPPA